MSKENRKKKIIAQMKIAFLLPLFLMFAFGESALAAPPSNESIPTISGSAQSGQTLQAEPGTWTPSGASFAYQWQRTFGEDGIWKNIPFATASSYQIPSYYPAQRLRVRVRAKSGDEIAYALSAATAAVQKAPESIYAPTLAGRAQVGQQLQASQGSWSAWPEATYSYQWQRRATTTWADIAGSTGATYTVQSGDRGSSLRVRVRATNTVGGSSQQTDAFSPPLGISEIPVRRTDPFIYSMIVQDRSSFSGLAPNDIRNAAASVLVPSGQLAESLSGCSYQLPAGQTEATVLSPGLAIPVQVSCPGEVGSFRPELRQNAVSDQAGNSGPGVVALGNDVVVDRLSPQANWAGAPESPTKETSFVYYLTWNDHFEVSGLEATDLSNAATTTENPAGDLEPLTGCSYSIPSLYRGAYKINPGDRLPITVSCSGGLGTFRPALAAGAVLDEAGNESAASLGPQIERDPIAPTASWQRVSSSPRLQTDFEYTLKISDHTSVFDIDPTDIEFRGDLPGLDRCRIVNDIPSSGSGHDTITVKFVCPRPASGVYNFWPVLRAGSVEDAAGNMGPASEVSGEETVFDYEPPEGGSLTVNSTEATFAGTSSYSTTGVFPISKTDATDISEPVENIITLDFAQLLNNSCSEEWSSAGFEDVSPQNIPQSGCWRYTLTSTDALGNSKSIRTTVRNDTTSPTVGLVLDSAQGSTWIDGKKVYYAAVAGRSGSFRALSEASDTETGIQSVLFPTPPDFLSGGGLDTTEPFQSVYSWSGTSTSSFGAQTVRATNRAGGTGEDSFELVRDTAPPTLTWGDCGAEGEPGPQNGWWRSPVRCSFVVEDAVSGPLSAEAEVSTDGGTTWQNIDTEWSGQPEENGVRSGSVLVQSEGADVRLRARATDRVTLQSEWAERSGSFQIDRTPPEDKTVISDAYYKSFRLLPATLNAGQPDEEVLPGALDVTDATSGWAPENTRCWTRPTGSTDEGTEMADCSLDISSSQQVRYEVFDRAGWSVDSGWFDIDIQRTDLLLQIDDGDGNPTMSAGWTQGHEITAFACVAPEGADECPSVQEQSAYDLGVDEIEVFDVDYGAGIASRQQLPDLQSGQGEKECSAGSQNCSLAFDVNNEGQRTLWLRASGEEDSLGQGAMSAQKDVLVQIDLTSPTFRDSAGARDFMKSNVLRRGAWQADNVLPNGSTLPSLQKMVNIQVHFQDPPLVLQLPSGPVEQPSSGTKEARMMYCDFGNRKCRKGFSQTPWSDLNGSANSAAMSSAPQLQGKKVCGKPVPVEGDTKLDCVFETDSVAGFQNPGAWLIASAAKDRAGNEAFLPAPNPEDNLLPVRSHPDYLRVVTRQSSNPFCPID